MGNDQISYLSAFDFEGLKIRVSANSLVRVLLTERNVPENF